VQASLASGRSAESVDGAAKERRRYRTGMPLPPTLSPEQRQAALDKAAAARRQRAELKEKLKMGSLTLKELLAQADTDEVVGKMKMLAVLESLPGLGKVKARRLMDDVGISETRRVQGLGANQRATLFERLTQL
jgi:hypothetical protein